MSVDSPTRTPDGAAPERERPLRHYGLLTAGFVAAVGAALGAATRSRGGLPERISTADVLLVSVATHKVSRVVTKDRVASFIRAPFTEHQEPGRAGEVEEAAQGTGLRRAVGELLTCPHCFGQWVAAGFTCGLVAAPRPTRVIAAMYAAEAVADFLQIAYRAADERA